MLQIVAFNTVLCDGLPMTVKLHSQLVQAMRTAVEQTYPEEGCGLLLGRLTLPDSATPVTPVDSPIADARIKVVVEVVPTANVWQPEGMDAFPDEPDLSRRRRYAIAPQVLLQTQKAARQAGLDIIGIYHSHPDYPAIPSEFDRKFAWSAYSYIIISVTHGHSTDLTAWTLDSHGDMVQEMVVVSDK